MNLQSTIRRDGTKVHYLQSALNVEAQPHPIIMVLKQFRRKILLLFVGKTNKTNRFLQHKFSWVR